MSGLICSGNVLVGILGANDAFMGYMGIQNVVKLTFKPGEGEKKVRKSKQIGTYGSALDTITLPGPYGLTMETDDIDAEILAMALLGSVSNVTAIAGTETVAPLEVVKLGVWLPLAHKNVSSVVVSSTGVVAVINANEYQVDLNAGLIRFLASGSTVAGDDVTIAYSYSAYNANKITPGTIQQLNITISGQMKNIVTGETIWVNVPKASVRPTKEIDWLGGDFAVNTLEGDLISIGSNAPFTVEIQS